MICIRLSGEVQVYCHTMLILSIKFRLMSFRRRYHAGDGVVDDLLMIRHLLAKQTRHIKP